MTLKYKNWLIKEGENVLTYHKKLCPLYWENDKLDEGIRKKLIKIARDFYESLELDTKIIDIELTGSISNYNYTKTSDLDVHVLIDYSDLGEDKDLITKAVEGEKFQWNERHNITLRGHEVELYIQDSTEVRPKNGRFSLLNNKWINKPKHEKPTVTDDDINPKYNSYVYEITELEKYLEETTDPDELMKYFKIAKATKKKLSEARASAIKEKGEFSIENLVFKKLRNEGFIGKLIAVKNGLYDKIFVQ